MRCNRPDQGGKRGQSGNVCIFALAVVVMASMPLAGQAEDKAEPNIFQATLQEPKQKTPRSLDRRAEKNPGRKEGRGAQLATLPRICREPHPGRSKCSCQARRSDVGVGL